MPVRFGKLAAFFRIPGNILDAAAADRTSGKEMTAFENSELLAQLHQFFDKTGKTPVLVGNRLPGNPGQHIVLTIRIVVAELGMRKLVAGQHHRRPERQQQRRHQRPTAGVAVGSDGFVVALAFGAGIPAPVAVAAVTVFFAVGVVVFAVITYQIAQCKTVMRRDKVDACPNIAIVIIEDIGRPGYAAGKFGRLAQIAFPETAHDVAKLIIPFGPARRKPADLIATVTDIPGFGNQLALLHQRILQRGI
ncbi:unknown [Azospirillum sp. CAG:239]|nr:unknown [Azospirillum sp. CAG:239]